MKDLGDLCKNFFFLARNRSQQEINAQLYFARFDIHINRIARNSNYTHICFYFDMSTIWKKEMLNVRYTNVRLFIYVFQGDNAYIRIPMMYV